MISDAVHLGSIDGMAEQQKMKNGHRDKDAKAKVRCIPVRRSCQAGPPCRIEWTQNMGFAMLRGLYTVETLL